MMILKRQVGLVFLLLLILSIISCRSGSQESHKEDMSGSIQLFNSVDFDGWYKFIQDRGRDNDPLDVFTVEDGIIRISGEEWGCITTEEEYEDYKIILEYKWGTETYGERADRARDNGLLFHSVGEDGAWNGIWMYSIECNIIEGGTGDFIVVGDGSDDFSITSPVSDEKQGGSYIYEPDGELVTINKGRINWLARDPDWRDELGFRGAHDVERPVGEWNVLEAELDGDHISIYLNGKLINEAMDVRPSKGKIQIQSEGAEMFVRKIELVPL